MRLILDASNKENITIQEEIALLSLYLDLEKLRFGKEFTFTIEVDPALDPQQWELPSILLQPFVENAIKHGLLHKKGQKELRISFRLGQDLICSIEDNGVGRVKSREIKARQAGGHASFALGAIHEQLEILNTSRHLGIRMHIEDLQEHGQALGTRVELRIPL